MKITVIFLVFLVVGSVSTYQHKMESDNKTVALSPAHEQPCARDVHAVLRELTASLAQQKVEMKVLQKETQAKLKELEGQKTEVDKLKQQLQVKQVAFSASLLARGHGYTGPVHTLVTLRFQHVITNVGKAYNPHTGVFTPPVRGVYHFEWHIGAPGNHKHPTGAVLYKNSKHIYIAYVHHTTHYDTTSNGATLLLEVGDVVFLRLWPNARLYDSHNHHTTFSGHLLFTM
ncbi:complement C1q-like protein 4 [Chaetodon trifascialis]|uniref:complement C1q-like protein 4 n=1 Tax=Chaetodon trifascialis TaxID=109706 RepID=UPI003991A9EC